MRPNLPKTRDPRRYGPVHWRCRLAAGVLAGGIAVLGLGTARALAAEAAQTAAVAAAGTVASAAAKIPVLEVPAKIARYAQRLIEKYDADGNGLVDGTEWDALPEALRAAAAPARHELDATQLAAYVARYAVAHPMHPPETVWPELSDEDAPADGNGDQPASAPADDDSAAGGGRRRRSPDEALSPTAVRPRPHQFHVARDQLPKGLPDWFVARDLDGDGQLTLGEYAPRMTPADLAQFRQLDTNHDGLLTTDECLKAGKPVPAERPAKGR